LNDAIWGSQCLAHQTCNPLKVSFHFIFDGATQLDQLLLKLHINQ